MKKESQLPLGSKIYEVRRVVKLLVKSLLFGLCRSLNGCNWRDTVETNILYSEATRCLELSACFFTGMYSSGLDS